MTKPLDISAAAAALGRKGGQSTSERKAAAARANGKRGGRPRKETKMNRSQQTITKQQARAMFANLPDELSKQDGSSHLILAGCPHCKEFQTRETYVDGFWVNRIEIVTDYTCMGIALCKCGKWSRWVH